MPLRPRPWTSSKATCVDPLCEGLSLSRGRRPYHAQRELVGTWEISRLAGRRYVAPGPHGEGDEPKPMMNGRETSDPAVVAAKSTNEAGQPMWTGKARSEHRIEQACHQRWAAYGKPQGKARMKRRVALWSWTVGKASAFWGSTSDVC